MLIRFALLVRFVACTCRMCSASGILVAVSLHGASIASVFSLCMRALTAQWSSRRSLNTRIAKSPILSNYEFLYKKRVLVQAARCFCASHHPLQVNVSVLDFYGQEVTLGQLRDETNTSSENYLGMMVNSENRTLALFDNLAAADGTGVAAFKELTVK
jgi:hypothetical protein